jgi:transcriptional regulator with XRE-family HTH domain
VTAAVPDGALIRRLRKATHEGLVAFARRAGVDAGQLSRIERGLRRRASYGWLLRVAEALGVPVEAIAIEDEAVA